MILQQEKTVLGNLGAEETSLKLVPSRLAWGSLLKAIGCLSCSGPSNTEAGSDLPIPRYLLPRYRIGNSYFTVQIKSECILHVWYIEEASVNTPSLWISFWVDLNTSSRTFCLRRYWVVWKMTLNFQEMPRSSEFPSHCGFLRMVFSY